MSTTVQFRRGTALQNQQFRGAAGEITIDMDNFQLRVHDGVNYGGHVISGGTTGGGGSVTSINVDGGTTGLTFTGGPITSNGTFTMAGRLAVISGGTGTANPVMTSTSPLAITGTWPNVNVALTGTVTVATGGTGISTTPGQNQVLLGDGSKYNLTTLRAGTGVNFDQTNPGVLTINSSGGSGSGTNVTLADLPPGTIQWFAMQAAPSGWLECDGRLLSKVTGSGLYAALWTAIGYTYNQPADGTADNFRIPDLRGQFLRGWDHGAGVDASRAFGSTQADELKSHTHAIDANHDNSTYGTRVRGTASTTVDGTQATQATGGTETRPKNVAMLACIKFTSGAAATLVSNVNVTSGFAALTFSGGPVTTSGIIQLNTNGGSNTTFLRGDGTWASQTTGQIQSQVFSTSTTWTCPANVTQVRATVIGGGGAGGGSTDIQRGGAGGYGGYAYGICTVIPGTIYTVTVGIGGTGGVGAAGNGTSAAGTPGQTSSFASLSATGGSGGGRYLGGGGAVGDPGTDGANGTGSGGTLRNWHTSGSASIQAGFLNGASGATTSAPVVWTSNGDGYIPGCRGYFNSGQGSAGANSGTGGVGGLVYLEWVG